MLVDGDHLDIVSRVDVALSHTVDDVLQDTVNVFLIVGILLLEEVVSPVLIVKDGQAHGLA